MNRASFKVYNATCNYLYDFGMATRRLLKGPRMFFEYGKCFCC